MIKKIIGIEHQSMYIELSNKSLIGIEFFKPAVLYTAGFYQKHLFFSSAAGRICQDSLPCSRQR
jgi:hypothetical protein